MNETNFSKYLEQRNSELYEQMLDENLFGDIVGGAAAAGRGLASAGLAGLKNFGKAAYDTVATGVKSGVKAGAMKGVKGIGDAAYNTVKTGIDSASKSYANRDVDRAKELMDYASDPDLINALKSYVSMTTNQQAPAQKGQQQAPTKQGQQAPNVDNNFLKSFKILFKAVKGTEFTDEMLDIVNKRNHSFPTMWGNLEKKLFEDFKNLWVKYHGREFSANNYWKKAKLFGQNGKIQEYLKLKNLVNKGSKHFSHPNYKPKAIPVAVGEPDDSLYQKNIKNRIIKAGEFDLPAVEHHNLTFKNWFNQRLTVEGEIEDTRAINKDRLCKSVQRIKSQIEDMKKQGADPKEISAMIIRHDDIATRCKKEFI
jgi:hypothetical protein